MKPAGFITLHRQILNWEWYGDTNTFRLFLHILLTANFTEGRFEGRVIERGQLVTSLTSLAAGTSLSVRQVRVSLDKLQMTGEVTSKAFNRYRVITVVKYDEYQSVDKQNDKQMTSELSGKRQADDKQMTGRMTSRWQQYNNNNNNINNENKGTINNNTAVDQDDSFDVFWNAYPKKVDKQAAVRAWKKIKPDGVLMGRIMLGLRKWIDSFQWTKEDGQYIPYPATWLNKRRWEDAPEEKKVQKVATSAANFEQRDYQAFQDEHLRKQSERIMRRLNSNNFEQRDYSNVDKEMTDELADEIRKAREEGII